MRRQRSELRRFGHHAQRHRREQRPAVLPDRRAQVIGESGRAVHERERERDQRVEHPGEMPLHRAGRRRVRILVGIVVGARDHGGRNALDKRA